MGGDGDLDQLIALASGPDLQTRRGGPRRRRAEPLSDDAAPDDPDGISALVAIGAMQPEEKYRQRGRKLLEHARACKKAKNKALQ